MNYERDYYDIEVDESGKYLHYLCFSFDADSATIPDSVDPDKWDGSEVSVAFHEISGVYLPLEGITHEALDNAAELATQYVSILTEREANQCVAMFFGGKAGEHLPLSKVNADTPCGDYWCYYDE